MAKHKIRRKRRDEKRGEGVVGLWRPLKAEEAAEVGGGVEGERAGEVATSPRKSRVMPTRNCTTPRAPLPTPPRSRLALTPSLAPPPRPFLPVLSPSLRFSLVPFASSPLCLLLHLLPPLPPHEIPPSVPGVWCAFSSRLHESPHRSHPPPGNNPLVERPPVRVSAAPPANLGETETIAAPTSTSCD